MPICNLHIGLPKSASTSLQDLILVNQTALVNLGIYVPETRTDGYRRAHHALAWEFYGNKVRDFLPGGFDELKTELAMHGTPQHILITSEAFGAGLSDPDNVERLRDTFAAMQYRLRILAYVRPQVSYINSTFTQQTKLLTNTLDIDEFVVDALSRERYDYAEMLLPMVEGEAVDTAFRPFNRAVPGAGIASDFLSTIGLEIGTIDTFKQTAIKNVSPGPKTIAACLAINRRLAGENIGVTRAQRLKISKMVREIGELLGWNANRYAGIGPDLARCIRDRFAVGNEAFAEAAWQRSWQDVYGEDSYTAPALNVFDPATAKAGERAEFDEVLGAAWQLLAGGEPFGADDPLCDTI